MSSIDEINSQVVLANSVKDAIDDSFKYKIRDLKIKHFNKLIKHNTKRKKELRKKYDCVLDNDLVYLADIFNRIRQYFYGIPIKSSTSLINGGLYVNCLPPRGHKTYKFFILNFRFKSDLEYVNNVKKLLKSHGFSCYVEYSCYEDK